ncbi:MAG TPA: hypothetical protein VEV38_00360 [Candidatus Eremiobacteraceae bacterium]|nr:hypothetical protein [Candidatus Eremiobacteraceae bacterium]
MEGMLRRIVLSCVRLAIACAFTSGGASQAASVATNQIHQITLSPAAAPIKFTTEDVRIVHASAKTSGTGEVAYRPVDASLLQAVAISKLGSIWIAPLRNGAQTSGTSERLVIFDPHSNTMAALKIPRLLSSTADDALAPDGSVWSTYSHLAAIRHANLDGTAEVFVGTSDDDETLGLAVDALGNAVTFEPLRKRTARIDGLSGEWNVERAPESVLPVDSAVLNGEGDAAFSTDDGTEITLRSRDGSVTNTSVAALGQASSLAIDSAGDAWFFVGRGVGEIRRGTSGATIWQLPEGDYVTALAPDTDGRLWLLGRDLTSFDPRTSTGAIVEPGVKNAGNVAAAGDGGAWVVYYDGLVHVDPSTSTAVKYTISNIVTYMPSSVEADRVCFTVEFDGSAGDDWNYDQPACLTPSTRTVTSYGDRFSPGVNGIVAAGDDMWLLEKGRATLLDSKYSIPRFFYPNIPTGPTGAIATRDGSLWLAGAGLIERYSAGRSQTYRVTYPGNGPFGLAADGDDGVAFAIGHAIGVVRIDAGGDEHLVYHDTGPKTSPEGIYAEPDGTIWCTDTTGWLLRVATDGVVKRYRVPTSPSEPYGIARGSDGAIWFTEFFAGKIGRLDVKTGAVREFKIPYADSFPTGLTAGAGDLWFLDLNNNVGRVSTAGKITEYPILAQSPVGY